MGPYGLFINHSQRVHPVFLVSDKVCCTQDCARVCGCCLLLFQGIKTAWIMFSDAQDGEWVINAKKCTGCMFYCRVNGGGGGGCLFIFCSHFCRKDEPLPSLNNHFFLGQLLRLELNALRGKCRISVVSGMDDGWRNSRRRWRMNSIVLQTATDNSRMRCEGVV